MFRLVYSIRNATIFVAIVLVGFLLNAKPTSAQVVPLMNPDTIVKFLDELPIPGLMNPALETVLTIGMYPIQQQYHANWPLTNMWGYGTSQATASSPARTIAAVRNVPTTVTWTNNLINPDGTFIKHPFDIDQTIPWADPLHTGKLPTRYDGPVPTVVHLHGGEVTSTSDGHYSSWFTPLATNSPVITGPTYHCGGTGVNHQTYVYANEQPAATIWFHDHAFGIDRLNVMMGLFGGYAIVDPTDGIEHIPAVGVNTGIIPTLPPYDFPVIIQDRLIDVNYQIAYQGAITNPTVHPTWFPEFFGNIIVVNGKVWPYKNVEQTIYRFRFLDGSNARFYHLYFSDGTPEYDALGNFVRYKPLATPLPFLQIASDGGFLEKAVQINDFLQAPGERIECLVDFKNFAVGTDIYLVNDANGPYPSGDPVDINTAMIMKFHVVPITAGYDDSYVRNGVTNGTSLKTAVTRPAPVIERNVVLFEQEGPGGPLAMFLDGIDMSDPRSVYRPVIGTVEKWNIINTTMDAHPMHWHLTQLQILGRQHFMNMDMPGMNGYLTDYKTANPILPIPYNTALNTVNVASYIDGPGTPISPGEEFAMKDTWVCPPSEVTSFLIKWTQENNTPYGFDASVGPGYVWHCHILEHEENAMMRELHPINPVPALNTTGNVLWLDGLKQEAYGPVDYTNMMPWLDHWTDQSGAGNNATQTVMMQQPMHDRYGVSCKEGIMFMSSMNSILTIPYSPLITTSNTNINNPILENKDLYLVFTPGTLVGRQTIFEAGGLTSGFNIYQDGTKLVFGIWHPSQRRFETYPLGTLKLDVPYLAHLEFNKVTSKYRVILNGIPTSKNQFKGLVVDAGNPTGIGGVAGNTRYADGTTGLPLTNSFNGEIGEVLLFNSYNLAQKQSVYSYLNWRFNQNWAYPTTGMPKEGIISTEEIPVIAGEVLLNDAYPNPSVNSTTIGYSLPYTSNVSLKVYDLMGNELINVIEGARDAGNYLENVNTSILPSGMYIYKLSADNFVQSKSFIVVR